MCAHGHMHVGVLMMVRGQRWLFFSTDISLPYLLGQSLSLALCPTEATRQPLSEIVLFFFNFLSFLPRHLFLPAYACLFGPP